MVVGFSSLPTISVKETLPALLGFSSEVVSQELLTTIFAPLSRPIVCSKSDPRFQSEIGVAFLSTSNAQGRLNFPHTPCLACPHYRPRPTTREGLSRFEIICSYNIRGHPYPSVLERTYMFIIPSIRLMRMVLNRTSSIHIKKRLRASQAHNPYNPLLQRQPRHC